jgi:hypothetical protein
MLRESRPQVEGVVVLPGRAWRPGPALKKTEAYVALGLFGLATKEKVS